MKRILNSTRSLSILSAALLTASLVACSGGQTAPSGPTIKTIELSPSSVNLAIGGTETLNAVARDTQGQVVPNAAFSWKSSSESVASVANGVVKGLAQGSAIVTASAGGVTSTPVTVNVAPAADFDLSLSADKLPVITGNSASLTVNITRHTGFTGAVSLSLSGLPTGASAAGVTIPEGQTSATVTVSAAANAPHSQPTPVILSAAGTVSKTITVTVRGPAGSLDTTFGTGGISVVPASAGDDYLNAMLVQPDGKIVVAGYAPTTTGSDFAVMRFERDGTLDSGFGAGGKVFVDFSGASDQANALALQSDGKIVVAGSASVGGVAVFGAARLNANGSLDTGFGTGGKATVQFGSVGDTARAVLVQPDGKIVLGGEANLGATGLDFALARLNANGSLDSGFGSSGKTTTVILPGSKSDVIRALALQGDKIVAVGGDGDFALARYTASGALDSGFGSGGTVKGVFGTSIGSAKAVVVDPAGRLLVAGNSNNNTAIAAFGKDGVLDNSFGTGGKTVIKVNPSNWNEATALALQADGKPVLGGWVYGVGSQSDFTVTRLTPGGLPDTGFGTGGTVITKVAPGVKTDEARALALQPDERIPATRILLAGPRNDSNNDFALTRYWP